MNKNKKEKNNIPKEVLESLKEEVKQELRQEIEEANKPLNIKPSKRNCHYKFDRDNNPNWDGQNDVWLKENVAISFHKEFMRRGAKYLGDQEGNMEPPRDYRAAFYNSEDTSSSGTILKKKEFGKTSGFGRKLNLKK